MGLYALSAHLNSKIGHPSQPAALLRVDGRSREGRFRKELRAQLVQHVGGVPSATQDALIDIAVDIAIQIELLKTQRLEIDLTSNGHRMLLAAQNAYRRTLAQIGVKGVTAAPISSLAAHMASRLVNPAK